MRRPGTGIAAHPSDRFDDFVVHLLQGAVKDGLVVHYTISEPANRIDPPMHHGSPLSSPRGSKSTVQRLAPQRGVVMGSQKADPEGKFEFSNNAPRTYRLGLGAP